MVKVFAFNLLGMKLPLLMIAGMNFFSYLTDFSYFFSFFSPKVAGKK
jgi:hypothetical protein